MRQLTGLLASLILVTIASIAEANDKLCEAVFSNANCKAAKVFSVCKTAAESGNAQAQLNLGVFYLGFNDFIRPDPDMAESWFRKAATGLRWAAVMRGNSEAQYSLGWMYASGYGLKNDYREAAKWFREAAVQGHAQAQSSLGRLYEDGLGVPKDIQSYLKWTRKSADQGSMEAQSSLGMTYFLGEDIEKDGREAEKWFRRAAEQGSPWAMRALVNMYYKGDGIPVNHFQAYIWYKFVEIRGVPLTSKFAPPFQDLSGVDLNELKKRLTPEELTRAELMAEKKHREIVARKKPCPLN